MRRSAGVSRTQKACRAWIRALVFLAAASVVFVGAAASFGANGPVVDAHRQFDAGNYQQAAAILRSALEQNARDATLYYWLARCYFELNDFDRAVPNAERSVELDPGNSEYHLWLGRAYGGKAERAGWFSGLSLAKRVRREFEEAVRLNPSNFAAQHDLLEFYLRAPGIAGGGTDKARQQVEAVAAVDPVEGHLVRGDFLADKKKPDQAEMEFRKVLEAQPKRVQPYLDIADFYLRRNDPRRMEEAVEGAARVDPSDSQLSYYRGVVRILAESRLPEAEHLLKSYLATVPRRSDLPSHASGREWLGRLYELEGKPEAAAEQYRAALEIDPHRKSAREALRHIEK